MAGIINSARTRIGAIKPLQGMDGSTTPTTPMPTVNGSDAMVVPKTMDTGDMLPAVETASSPAPSGRTQVPTGIIDRATGQPAAAPPTPLVADTSNMHDFGNFLNDYRTPGSVLGPDGKPLNGTRDRVNYLNGNAFHSMPWQGAPEDDPNTPDYAFQNILNQYKDQIALFGSAPATTAPNALPIPGGAPITGTTTSAPAPGNPAARGPGGITRPPSGPPATGNPAERPPNVGGEPDMTNPGVAFPPPGGGTSAAPTAATWSPTAGIIDQIRGITPQDVTATSYTAASVPNAQQATATSYDANGYTAERAPDAQGYDATGYDAATANENVSQATDRIIGQDSELLQREKALAQGDANARGIINSTMAVQAGQAAVLDKASALAAGDVQAAQFNATAMNQARAFLADAKNVSAQFLAAAKNQNGQFNVQQANDASKFAADAGNQAKAALAAAKNTASLSNSAEANKQSQFAIEQLNLAAKYAADAQNAASAQNAQAHNEAMQRYADAMNAALAAQNDAENLAKRDAAQSQNTLTQAQLGANTSENVARINQSTQLQVSAADIAQRGRELDATMERFGVQMDQQAKQFAQSLSAQQFAQYQQGLQNGMSLDMEPADRQNWLHNYNAVWAASGSLPFDIDMSGFPPATENTTTNPPPPNSPPPPASNPAARNGGSLTSSNQPAP